MPATLTPASSQKKTLRALVCGYGSIGRRHVKNLQQLGVNDFVLYRTGKGTLPVEDNSLYCTDSIDEALAMRPNIAIISNPTADHVTAALLAAESKCDLYIEKPLSHSLSGVDKLQRIVESNRLVAMIGCQYRFHPLLGRLREEINNGRLGKIVGARAEWGEYLPNWHPWEDHRLSYSARADLGGGVILTLIHPLDYLYWLLGPCRVVAAATKAIPSLETPAQEDWTDIILRFETDAIATVHLDYLQRPAVHNLAIIGDLGNAAIDFHAGTLKWQNIEGQNQTESVPAGFERNTMFVDMMRHFLECVEHRRQPEIPLKHGEDVLKLALTAQTLAKHS